MGMLILLVTRSGGGACDEGACDDDKVFESIDVADFFFRFFLPSPFPISSEVCDL